MNQPELRRRQSSEEGDNHSLIKQLAMEGGGPVVLSPYSVEAEERLRTRSGATRIPMFDFQDGSTEKTTHHESGSLWDRLQTLFGVLTLSAILVASGIALRNTVQGLEPTKATDTFITLAAETSPLSAFHSAEEVSSSAPRRLQSVGLSNQRLHIFPRGQHHVAPLFIRLLDVANLDQKAPNTIRVSFTGEEPRNEAEYALPASGIIRLPVGTHRVRAALFLGIGATPLETIDTVYHVVGSGKLLTFCFLVNDSTHPGTPFACSEGQLSYHTNCHTQTLGCVVFNETSGDMLANYGAANQPVHGPLPLTGFTNATTFSQVDNILAVVQNGRLFMYGDCLHPSFAHNCDTWRTANPNSPLGKQGYEYFQKLDFNNKSEIIGKFNPSYMLRLPNMRTDYRFPNISIPGTADSLYYRWSYNLEDGQAAGPVSIVDGGDETIIDNVVLSETHGLVLGHGECLSGSY